MSQLSQDKPRTKCHHTDAHAHCPRINPKKVSLIKGGNNSLPVDIAKYGTSVQSSQDRILESMAEK